MQAPPPLFTVGGPIPNGPIYNSGMPALHQPPVVEKISPEEGEDATEAETIVSGFTSASGQSSAMAMVVDEDEEMADAELSDDITSEEEEEGDDEEDYFEDVDMVESHSMSPTVAAVSQTATRTGSILKMSTTNMYVSDKKRSWLQLPRPDLQKIPLSQGSQAFKNAAQTATNAKRKVVFASIEVRGYEQTLGDNPCVSYGPPITLDWQYQEYGHFDFEAFEANRGPRRKLRNMCLNYYQRMNLLQHHCGIPEHELKAAERKTNKIKAQRNLTRNLLPCQKLEEVVQSARRKAGRKLGRKWTEYDS